MTLIKSISGIRGTIGGQIGKNLTPIDVVKFSSAYGMSLKLKYKKENIIVIVGRDSRVSGKIINKLVTSTLQSLGINVIDLGVSTTPTVQIAVIMEKANGGIILTASHNPKNWNALKLLDHNGEFISEKLIRFILKLSDKNKFFFVKIDQLGYYKFKKNYIQKHIKAILSLPLVDIQAIKSVRFKIVVDGVNSIGGIAVPMLLETLGVEIIKLHCEPNGNFSHNPELLHKNLRDICKEVPIKKANLGIAVDPDVDRLVFICENGKFFGEEYTLVAIADYILKKNPGPTVSNLSSSMALKDITIKNGMAYYSSPIGEMNVVKKMKEVGAVIGGEGNGGIIYPELHYGRDALVGIALFLTYLSYFNQPISQLRIKYPNYFMLKKKIKFFSQKNIESVFNYIKKNYKKENLDLTDGIKINFSKEWIHLRKSNTEPIIRIYIESDSQQNLNFLFQKILNIIHKINYK